MTDLKDVGFISEFNPDIKPPPPQKRLWTTPTIIELPLKPKADAEPPKPDAEPPTPAAALKRREPPPEADALPPVLAPLIDTPQWVIWKWEQVGDKNTKVPYQGVATKRRASTKDSATWCTYSLARSTVKEGHADGVGFVLTGTDILAFDIDGCRDKETGVIHPWARKLVERADSYTEVTPSGTGLRIIGHGSGATLHRKLPVAHGVSCELYRKATRYITVSGQQLGTADRLANLDELMDETHRELDEPKVGTPEDGGHHEQQGSDALVDVEDLPIPRWAKDLATGEPGCRDKYPSNSEAVYALVGAMVRGGVPDNVQVAVLLDPRFSHGVHLQKAGNSGASAQRQIDKYRKDHPPGTETALPKEGGNQYRFFTSDDFIKDYEPPDYLLDGILLNGNLHSLTGKTGSGKTAVMLSLAVHVALGIPFGGLDVTQGRVLYFAGENPDDIRMRWITLADKMKFDTRAIDVHFMPGTPDISQRSAHAAVMENVEKHGELRLVCIDTSAAYFKGEDESSNVQAGNFARDLRWFKELPGKPCTVVNCHPTKSGDSLVPRGGGAFLNEVDGNLTCRRDAQTCIADIHWEGKIRGPEFNPLSLLIETTTSERLKDSRGRHIKSVWAKPLSAFEAERIQGIGDENLDKLLALLHTKPGLSQVKMAEELGWFMHNGELHKVMVGRLLKKLQNEHKLVELDHRGDWKLTKSGEKAAKGVVAANETAI